MNLGGNLLIMPKAEDNRRGGAKRYRKIRLSDGRTLHVAVVPKARPRGARAEKTT